MVIGIINYGFSNITSVKNAVYELGYDYRILGLSDNPNIDDFTHMILPGVGNFGSASDSLYNSNFSDFIHAWVNDDKPILGICLGMQLLFNGSEESTNSPGLAFIPGTVKKLPITNRLRIPHIGWNEIEIIQSDLLTEGVKSHCDMYFVHSYYCPISEYTVAKTYYGVEYSSVLKKGNIVGMQFHPEKSQKNGLNILNNFLELV